MSTLTDLSKIVCDVRDAVRKPQMMGPCFTLAVEETNMAQEQDFSCTKILLIE